MLNGRGGLRLQLHPGFRAGDSALAQAARSAATTKQRGGWWWEWLVVQSALVFLVGWLVGCWLW